LGTKKSEDGAAPILAVYAQLEPEIDPGGFPPIPAKTTISGYWVQIILQKKIDYSPKIRRANRSLVITRVPVLTGAGGPLFGRLPSDIRLQSQYEIGSAATQ
jgi:hypothetical protein